MALLYVSRHLEIQLVKKVKPKDSLADSFSAVMVQDCTSCDLAKRKISFHDIVEGPFDKDVRMGNLTDDYVEISDASEEDEKDDPACFTIRMSKQDKLQIRESWRHTLILKVLG